MAFHGKTFLKSLIGKRESNKFWKCPSFVHYCLYKIKYLYFHFSLSLLSGRMWREASIAVISSSWGAWVCTWDNVALGTIIVIVILETIRDGKMDALTRLAHLAKGGAGSRKQVEFLTLLPSATQSVFHRLMPVGKLFVSSPQSVGSEVEIKYLENLYSNLTLPWHPAMWMVHSSQ